MEPENLHPRYSWVSVWSVIVALLINSVGLSLIYARLKTSPAQKLDQLSTGQKYQQILDELTSLHNQINRAEISQLQTTTPVLGTNTDRGGQLSDLLADPTPLPTPAGYITITSSQNSQVDVYKESASFSPIIDKIIYGQKYPFNSELNNWYLITLPGGKSGWVNSQYVKEVPLGQ